MIPQGLQYHLSYISFMLVCKVVTSRMNCVLAGTSARGMTLTGGVVRDPDSPTTQVPFLDIAFMGEPNQSRV